MTVKLFYLLAEINGIVKRIINFRIILLIIISSIILKLMNPIDNWIPMATGHGQCSRPIYGQCVMAIVLMAPIRRIYYNKFL